MPDNEICSPANGRTPWNKGKLIGARPKHIWAIRTQFLLEGRIRDFALFNRAIDSKLRGMAETGRYRLASIEADNSEQIG